MNTWKCCCLLLALTLGLPCAVIAAPEGPVTEYLVVPKVGKYGKASVHYDPIDAAIASGEWRAPAEGETVEAADGATVAWSKHTASANGAIADRKLAGGYAFATIDADEERVMLLKATRHASARFNGAWLAGDPYGLGFVETPVVVKPGANELLLHLAAPKARAEFIEPTTDYELRTTDAVLPDVVRGREGPLWMALTLVNASREPLVGAQIATKSGEGAPMVTVLPRLEPLSIQRVSFQAKPQAEDGKDSVGVRVTLTRRQSDATIEEPVEVFAEEEESAAETGPQEKTIPEEEAAPPESEPDVLAEATVTLKVVAPTALATRTFRSRIDGSVQPYAVLPASEPADDEKTGVILSLHGRGVDCRKHAALYQAKPWAHVVAPQGRRRYCLDWEDWSAADAMEALEASRAEYPSNPRRACLTGEGVGGHGAWLLGTQAADRFAAVGPSNGWLSYWSIGRMPAIESPTPIESMLARGASPSDTLAVLKNLESTSVYVAHDAGSSSVAQSRFARRRLGDFHRDFVYFERRPTSDSSPAPDWPGMMGLFRDRETPANGEVTRLDFTTTDPGRSSRSHWAVVEAQETPYEPSRVVLQQDLQRRSISGRTENVARLTLDVSHLPGGSRATISVRLDGSPKLTVVKPTPGRGEEGAYLRLAKDESGRWRQAPRFGAGKTARRQGGFKSVFNHRPVLVYGTAGSEEENRWAAAKARYDAQTFWVRAGGTLEVVPDNEFNPLQNPNRSVVLYGNARTNRAWPALLSTSPVQIQKGLAYVGVRPEAGSGIGVLMVRPRRGSKSAMVGVVGGTGLAGMRLTNRLRYFVPGVAYPDLLLIGGEAPASASADIRAVGSFGYDWSLDKGDIVWRDLAL